MPDVAPRRAPVKTVSRYEENEILLGLRALMVGYLSTASVDATLEASLAELGLEAEGVGPKELEALVERAMLGLRLFCSEDRLPELMLDLADFCHEAGR